MATEPAQPIAGATSWKHRPERSALWVLRLMTWLSLTMGRRASRVILTGIALYFMLFAPAARRASKDYLRRALGRTPVAHDGFRHVFSFAAVTHDRVYWLRDRHDLFDVRVRGEQCVEELRTQGRGIILMGAHFGSFEAMRAVGDRHGLDARMLMFPDNARMVTTALAAINPGVADRVIALGRPESVLKVRDHLATGGAVGILADRVLSEDPVRATQQPFLGSPASFPMGPFRLAALLRAPVVFMAGMYQGGNRYDLYFHPVADFGSVSVSEREAAIEAAQASYAQLLEQCCREAPWNWFNFYDFWSNNSAP